MLERLVLCVRGEQHQVFRSVVRRIVVDVVYRFGSRQYTTDGLGNE